MTSIMPLLTVKELGIEYFDPNTEQLFPAVCDISFSLYPQNSLGIVGESGSGKSITLLSILGLVNTAPGITRGNITLQLADKVVELLTPHPNETVNRTPITRKNADSYLKQKQRQLNTNYKNIRGKQISMIFQNPKLAFNPYTSIGNQICEMIRLHTSIKDTSAVKNKALYWLKKVGIEDVETRFHNNPYGLSGGLCQRAMIALALSSEPKILLADEPTTGLDAVLQLNIIRLLKQLQTEFKLAMIVVSHDLRIIRALCDDVLIFHSGMIVEQGPVARVLENSDSRHPFTRQLMNAESDTMCFVSDNAEKFHPDNGCSFYKNCAESYPSIAQQCARQTPPLTFLTNDAAVRCWKYNHD